MSPIFSLFFKYPITEILKFNLLILPLDLIFPCRHPCMGSMALPYLGNTLKVSDC